MGKKTKSDLEKGVSVAGSFNSSYSQKAASESDWTWLTAGT